jgi:asparagine N-glycosylation enzyme membrane subunit Stt3
MRKRLPALLLFVASALVGVLARAAIYWNDAPDALYHLRRARFALENFPRTIIFDPLMNFADGGNCIWPPLFDVMLAVPALLLGGRSAPVALLERTAAWMPVVFAAAAIVAAGLVGLAVRRRVGVLAALFLAISPAHLQYSQYGRADQHVAETCWGFFALAFFLFSCTPGRRKMAHEAACGIFLALAVLTWQGSIFWALIFSAVLVLEAVRADAGGFLRRCLLILGIPAAMVALSTRYWLGGFDVPFTYVSFGWFQPVFLAATCAVVLAVHLTFNGRVMAPRSRLAAGLMLAATALPVLVHARSFFSLVLSGGEHLLNRSHGSEIVSGGFVSYPAEWLAQIVEYRPLLADDLAWPIGFLSLTFFLSPLVFFSWARRAIRGPRASLYGALLAWGLFTFVITLVQRRHVYYAALLAAVVAVEISARVAVLLRKRLARSDRRLGARVLAPVIFFALALPMLFQLRKELARPYELEPDYRETLATLRDLGAGQIDPFDPRFLEAGTPIPELERAQSVMAFWSQGHLVTYHSQLPVVANNFGYNFFDSVRFFLAETEDEALEIAKVHRVRFVLVMDLLPIVDQYGQVLGRSGYTIKTPEGGQANPRYFRTLQSRLEDFDGEGATMGDQTIPPLEHFRLRHASKTGVHRFGRFVAKWKIFEVVP